MEADSRQPPFCCSEEFQIIGIGEFAKNLGVKDNKRGEPIANGFQAYGAIG
jgi:hypothetical protein